MASASPIPRFDEEEVLAEAVAKAAKELGFTQAEIGLVIGKDRTFLGKGRISPSSKTGELALMFLRCFRGLFALMGGNIDQMRHWMQTANLHTGGVPAQQIQSVTGLSLVMEYVDSMRAKV